MADLALARKVLETEAAAILALVPRIDERFDCAVDLLRGCRGRVILTGMGKSGIICRKIAATLTSTGTASQFLHPAEALHGHLGVIQGDDVVIAVSSSGETAEVLRLLETFKLEDVHAAIGEALRLGAIGYDAVKHLVLCRIERRPPKLDLLAYPYLPRVTVATTSAKAYLALLGQAA